MTSDLLIAPVAVPLATAIVLVLLRGRNAASRAVAAVSTLGTLGISIALARSVVEHGVLVLEMGGWPAPFGIAFVADGLGITMVVVAMVVSTACLFFSLGTIDEGREGHFFYAFFQFLLMGVNGAFLTGDLFNLFVWFEVLLISSYVLLALGGEGYQLQETFKYLVMNALGSAFFLVGVAAVYGLTGTVNMADLAVRWREIDEPALQSAIALTFLFVFGLKGAIFPLYYWLPRSYFAPPYVVSALFGGILTKVGVYAIFRSFSLIFTHDTALTHGLLVVLAGLTMLFGVLGALSQNDMKRILSFHIVSQIGYMIMGIGLFTPLAVAGGVYYVVHHIIVKTALFLVGGTVEKSAGSTHLSRVGGVANELPFVAVCFLVVALSLAGIPPFSGFFSKLALIRAGFEIESWGIVATSIFVSFLTLFSMVKIFRNVFWGEPGKDQTSDDSGLAGRAAPIAVLAGLTIFLGFSAEAALGAAQAIADQLLDPDVYVQAVLSARGEAP